MLQLAFPDLESIKEEITWTGIMMLILESFVFIVRILFCSDVGHFKAFFIKLSYYKGLISYAAFRLDWLVHVGEKATECFHSNGKLTLWNSKNHKYHWRYQHQAWWIWCRSFPWQGLQNIMGSFVNNVRLILVVTWWTKITSELFDLKQQEEIQSHSW